MNLDKKKFLSISTKKYSQFFQEVFQNYNVGCIVEIDKKIYKNGEIINLISQWCTNSSIVNTRNFVLSKNGAELFYFHDHPEQLIGAVSEKNFLKNLVQNKIIKVRLLHQNNSTILR